MFGLDFDATYRFIGAVDMWITLRTQVRK